MRKPKQNKKPEFVIFSEDGFFTGFLTGSLLSRPVAPPVVVTSPSSAGVTHTAPPSDVVQLPSVIDDPKKPTFFDHLLNFLMGTVLIAGFGYLCYYMWNRFVRN